jgi:glycosidase
MYEVNIRAFSPQHDLAGVTGRLDSIRALGINVIWLMPIYPVGQRNAVPPMGSPYAVKDYRKVNPAFGTLDDLRTLVSEAHQRGMSVILDWVGDHSSWDNPWIANKSWYQQDASGNIVSPPGQSWNDVAALNYKNTEMRQAMIGAMKYWLLAANIDGYRCDYTDGPPLDFWKQAVDSLKKMSPHHQLIMLAETGSKNIFSAGFQMNYGWDYYTALKEVFGSGKPATDLITVNAAGNSGLPGGAFKLRFTSNHDEDLNDNTPLGLFNGKQGSLAAFVLAAYMGGVPLVYNGQEVGDPVKIPIFDTSTIDWSLNRDMTVAYQQLLHFRSTSGAVKEGSVVSYSSPDVVVFERQSASESVLVIVNVRDASTSYTPDSALKNTSWKDVMNHDSTVHLDGPLLLPPYCYRILLKN